MDNSYATIINTTLTMESVWRAYGNTPIKKHVVLCPFHAEDTPSMRLYEHSWFCFGCNQGGDIVKFVQLYFKLDFRAALMRLDYNFNLGLNLGQKLTSRQRHEMRLQADERKRQAQAQKEQEEAAERQYWTLWDEWIRLDKNQMKYAPTSPDESLHPLFVESLHKKPYQEYLIDCLL